VAEWELKQPTSISTPVNLTTGRNSAGNCVIDGYGTLIFKGRSHQCLRCKHVEVPGYMCKGFSYFTKDGIFLTVGSRIAQNDMGLVAAGEVFAVAGGTVASVTKSDVTLIAYSLSQNYPNPFNPSTTTRFSVPLRSQVHLSIINLLGQQVAVLASEEMDAGYFERTWNANVAPGLCFYQIQAVALNIPSERFVDVRKMMLLK
jgi:hypothetical protein